VTFSRYNRKPPRFHQCSEDL